MSELKTTQQLHADNDISLAWDEYEKCGEVGNYAENLLHAAEFYQTEAKTKEQENRRLTVIATKHATRADELYEALESLINAVKNNTGNEPSLSCYHKAIDDAVDTLNKSRIEAEKGDGICN